MTRTVFAICLIGFSTATLADILDAGTWAQRDSKLVITIENLGGARKLTYRVIGADGKPAPNFESVTVTKLDGKDSPVMVNGKVSEQTLAIQRIDSRHAVIVSKMGGKVVGTSKSEISPDGKVMKVEEEHVAGAVAATGTKQTKYWDRK